MAYTASQVADAIWTYSTRTLAAGSATTGTTPAQKIADAVWTSVTRTLTSALATALTLSGPASAVVGSPSSFFTVALSPVGGTVASPITVTPASTVPGSFSPLNFNLATATPSSTFTFTPTGVASGVISLSNSSTLTNPTPQAFAATSSSFPATSLILTGPTSGLVSGISQPFTVKLSPLGGTVTGSITVTLSKTGSGTLSVPTLTLTTASPVGTFTYTDPTSETSVVSMTNNGGLTNPSGFSYLTSTSNITVTSYSPNEHTITLNTGTVEFLFHHLSDVNISLIRASASGSENANDATGLPVIISN